MMAHTNWNFVDDRNKWYFFWYVKLYMQILEKEVRLPFIKENTWFLLDKKTSDFMLSIPILILCSTFWSKIQILNLKKRFELYQNCAGLKKWLSIQKYALHNIILLWAWSLLSGIYCFTVLKWEQKQCIT